MKWLWPFIILGLIGGLIFFVWDYNRKIEVKAADNNGAVCQVSLKLDDELWGIYTGGDFAGAVIGNLTSTQNGNTLTTTGTVTSQQPELINEIRDVLNQLDLVAGSVCDVSITRIPSATPGRIMVDVRYYRPFPVATPTQGGA